jgi:hypothetical protein
MTKEIEQKFLACKVKSAYATLINNLIRALGWFVLILILGAWIAISFVAFACISHLIATPSTAETGLILGLVAVMVFNGLASCNLIFDSVHKKDFIPNPGRFDYAGTAFVTFLFVFNIATWIIYALGITDLLAKVSYLVFAAFALLFAGYVVTYNMCEIRLLMARVGRYRIEE